MDSHFWSARTLREGAWTVVKPALRAAVREYNFSTSVNDQYPMQVSDTVPAWVVDDSPKEP